MDFIEIAIENIDGEAAETVSELFNRYGQGGAVIESYPPDFKTVTVRTVIAGDDTETLRQIEMMLALIGKALPDGLPDPRLQPIGESDWAESWKEHFHVVRVGKRFVIQPSWREYTPAEDDIVIHIDPGLAFGSGLHPTTRLCLELFEQFPLAGKSLFDVGTGSGVLTLAALHLGARPVHAVDNDPVAVRVAKENFDLNGFTAVEPTVGSAEARAGRQWDFVVANILAHILIALMPNLAAAVAPGGHLLLSGMITEQADEVAQLAEQHGLTVIERYSDGDWIALLTMQET